MNRFNSFNYKNEVDYWFKNIEDHGEDVFSYGPKYYVGLVLKKIMPILELPCEGKVCMLGTHNCFSFGLLEEFYGMERCIGFDLYNPTKRTNIREGSIVDLDSDLLPPLSFCWNDLGNYSRTPFEKMFGQILFSNRILKGGVFIGRDSSNRARFPVEILMKEMNYYSETLLDFFLKNNLSFKEIDESILSSHLISFRKENKEYF